MSEVDTRAEANAMLAYQIRYLPAEGLALSCTREDFARHVEALAAERDAAQAEIKTWGGALLLAIKDRDAAQAEVARLRELLRDVTDALEPHVPTLAKHREPYEHPLSAYDRARAALAKEAPRE